MSLKWRLTLLFLAAALIVWLPVNYWFYRNALREVDQLYDAHLAQAARVLLTLAAASTESGELEHLGELLPALAPYHLARAHAINELSGMDPGEYERLTAFQVLGRDGSIRLASADAPDQPLASGVAGFSDSLINGTPWRVFGLGDPKHGLVLYAGEHHTIRERLAWHLVENLLIPTLLATPLLLFLMWIAVAKGLSPLILLARAATQRDPQDLRPLSAVPVPAEVRPLVDALNALFERVEQAMESERQFTGNAAHELRTPLAALHVQAQVAKRATNDAQRLRALDQIVASVRHAAHLVDQLLTLSRLDARNGLPAEEPVKLLEVAERTAVDLEPVARERSVRLRVEGMADAVTRGDATCIGILFRNLMDNAVRYSPEDAEVAVCVRKCGLFNRVVVTDTGPGVPDGQHAEMFQRFRRGAETQMPGSGLGLSIVRRICELHGGSVQLANGQEGGLRCEVRLPPAEEEDTDQAPRTGTDD